MGREKNRGVERKARLALSMLRKIPAAPPVAVIFLFHTVEQGMSPWTHGHRYVTPFDRFKKQIAFIKANFSVLPTSMLIEQLDSGRLCGNTAAIHFDDGFASYADLALPYLESQGLPSTLFPVVAVLKGEIPVRNKIAFCLNCGCKDRLLDAIRPLVGAENGEPALKSMCNADFLKWIKNRLDRPMEVVVDDVFSICRQHNRLPSPFLDCKKLQQVARRSGVEIGSHTVTHPILAMLDRADQEREILLGHSELEAMLGCKLSLFAYPHGGTYHFVQESREIVASSHLTAFSAYGGVNRCLDQTDVRRITLTDFGSLQIKLQVLSALM